MRHVVLTTCHARDPHALAPQARANSQLGLAARADERGPHRSPLFKVSSRQAMLCFHVLCYVVRHGALSSRPHGTRHMCARVCVYTPSGDRYVAAESNPLPSSFQGRRCTCTRYSMHERHGTQAPRRPVPSSRLSRIATPAAQHLGRPGLSRTRSPNRRWHGPAWHRRRHHYHWSPRIHGGGT